MRQNNIFDNVETEDDSSYLINDDHNVQSMSQRMRVENESNDNSFLEQTNENVIHHFENIKKSVSYRIEDIDLVPEKDLFDIIGLLYEEWQLDYKRCAINFNDCANIENKIGNIGNDFFQKFSTIFLLDWNLITNIKNHERHEQEDDEEDGSTRNNNDLINNMVNPETTEEQSFSDDFEMDGMNREQVMAQMEGKMNPHNMFNELERNFAMRMEQIKAIRNELQFNKFRKINKLKKDDDINYVSHKSLRMKQDSMIKMIDNIHVVLHSGFTRLKSDIMLICYNDGFNVVERIQDEDLIKKLDYDGNSLKDQTKLLLRAIGHVKKKGYAKKDPDVLCRQKFVEMEVPNKQGKLVKQKYSTHCWVDTEKKESIENVLKEWSSINQPDMSNWSDMFSNHKTISNIATLLFNQRTYHFPTVETITTLYSFRNGLLCLDADDEKTKKYFGTYEEMEMIEGVVCNQMETELFLVSLPTNHPDYKPSDNEEEKVTGTSIRFWFAPYPSLDFVNKKNQENMDRMSSNVFIDESFNERMINLSIKEDNDSFFERFIHCDQLNRIFAGQKYSEGLIRDLYALVFGRITQPYHKHDRAHIVPALLGVGGAGKSVILKVLRSFFQHKSIAVLSAGQQKEFGMEKLIGKKIWIYDEMEEESNVGFDVFKQLASGEVISVNQKHLKTVDEIDVKAGIFCGNKLASNFEDSQGQASRRIAVFLFTETAGAKEDETLEQKVMAQRSEIIMRGFYSYFHLVNRINSKKMRRMWSVLDKELKNQQQLIQSKKNTVLGFLKDENSLLQISKDSDVDGEKISYKEFMDKYNFYCKSKRIPSKKTLSDYTDIMIALKVASIQIVKIMCTKGKEERFIIGLERNYSSSLHSIFKSKTGEHDYPMCNMDKPYQNNEKEKNNEKDNESTSSIFASANVISSPEQPNQSSDAMDLEDDDYDSIANNFNLDKANLSNEKGRSSKNDDDVAIVLDEDLENQ